MIKMSIDKDKNKEIFELIIAKSIDKLVDLFSESTEIGNREVKPLAWLSNYPELQPFINSYENKTKHKKRKRESSIIKLIAELKSILRSRLLETDLDNLDNKRLSKLLSR